MRTVEEIFLARQEGREQPVGHFREGNKWYPSRSEHRHCCYEVLPPTDFFPGALYEHCKSLTHIHNLINEDEF